MPPYTQISPPPEFIVLLVKALFFPKFVHLTAYIIALNYPLSLDSKQAFLLPLMSCEILMEVSELEVPRARAEID